METINFIDRSKEASVQQGLTFLCEQLTGLGIRARWCPRVEEADPGAILLLHDPVDEDKIPPGCRVLGQRCLNRRQRLVLAERCGLPVVSWTSVADIGDIPKLFDRWGVDAFLFKADWSYSRGGIKCLTRRDWQPFNPRRFNPDADVFMRILNGSPDTHKVDLFYDQAFACRHMHTRSVFDRKFYKGFYQRSELGFIPPLEPALKRLGKALTLYGQGFSGVDFMYDAEGQPWVIELNTSSLGREGTWSRWPDVYLNGYLAGLKSWIRAGCPAEFCHGIPDKAAQLTELSGGALPLSQPDSAVIAGLNTTRVTKTEKLLDGVR
ncbi:hypothetical protein SG34_014725 [Thalassomonas viridans]|uniref:ATP-grasp domain-containing protein n=1 Tax=Thalassomonas viridans TaxID=137584 RepID=A0AAE9Z862_9GAMM|nr:hypothetical protein [Thalassomonas viridans]WDE08032.1 hypothetical protein SG34_014725 [Thalassomonas viridans]